jgi:hypothetical protein
LLLNGEEKEEDDKEEMGIIQSSKLTIILISKFPLA